MRILRKHEQARRDLIEHFVYLADHADIATADRFLVNAEATFVKLVARPLSGRGVRTLHPELAGMRLWRVKGFDNWLIFYLPSEEGVSIVRVLHAAQDWWSILGYRVSGSN